MVARAAAKPRDSSRPAAGFTAETDSLLEESGFEPSVPRDTRLRFERESYRVLDIPPTKAARTRADTTEMPEMFRGTDGSNPLPSSGESCKPSVPQRCSRRRHSWRPHLSTPMSAASEAVRLRLLCCQP